MSQSEAGMYPGRINSGTVSCCPYQTHKTPDLSAWPWRGLSAVPQQHTQHQQGGGKNRNRKSLHSPVCYLELQGSCRGNRETASLLEGCCCTQEQAELPRAWEGTAFLPIMTTADVEVRKPFQGWQEDCTTCVNFPELPALGKRFPAEL